MSQKICCFLCEGGIDEGVICKSKPICTKCTKGTGSSCTLCKDEDKSNDDSDSEEQRTDTHQFSHCFLCKYEAYCRKNDVCVICEICTRLCISCGERIKSDIYVVKPGDYIDSKLINWHGACCAFCYHRKKRFVS